MASDLFRIKFSFINSKGKEKTVNVFIDRGTKDILPKLNEDQKTEYLKELYHDQEREKNYRRKTITFTHYINDDETYYDPKDDNYNLEETVYKNKLIRDILESLNEKDRRLIILFYFQGYKIYEIAKKIGVTEKTVSTNIRRILKEIREKFIQ